VHRRVILRDYGKAIYKASSRSALLAALEGCIKGHEALHKEGFLHRDISINNLMINEDRNNPDSWPSFLIDLDLAIEEGRENASGAKGRTGTRAFMAIGVLQGERHSFMHDLESFFWVLFWICIHYEGPGQGRVVKSFDPWNFLPVERLVREKLGTVCSGDEFSRTTTEFTKYYKPLAPWMSRLREVVFPNGEKWRIENEGLYDLMKGILREAQEDREVLEADGNTQA
jgi:serine/threonine protein kinase